MHLLELFPTIVGIFECATFDSEAPAWRVEIANAIKEREQQSGKTEHQTDDRLHERPGLDRLMDFFRQTSAEYMLGLKYGSGVGLRLQCCWATVALRGDRFEMHQHSNSFLSGAFYLNVDEAAEPVLFRDPRPQNRNLDIPVEEELRINRKYYTIGPRNGRLVLFPSWLEHRVGPNMSEAPRVSLSFNMTVHGEVGSLERLSRATI
jgi:uncharacterized protein (TIGR02466 family)